MMKTKLRPKGYAKGGLVTGSQKPVNTQREYASNRPGENAGGVCDTDSDCAALARRLRLDNQDGGPAPESDMSKMDKSRLEAYYKQKGSSEVGRHESLEKGEKSRAAAVKKKQEAAIAKAKKK